jgi:hypothetical protein
LGLALSWNRNSWQLDTVPSTDQGALLDKAELLPLVSSHPGKGEWAAGLTWMAFLPSSSPLHLALQILGAGEGLATLDLSDHRSGTSLGLESGAGPYSAVPDQGEKG